MTGRIKVSVIIPCFNDAEYISDAIQSVHLEQNTDTEIVVCDDGSTKKETIAVLEALEATKNERVRVLYNRHGGPAAARNGAISEAKGKYILPLDVDDRIEPEYVSKAEEILDECQKVGAVYCHADLFGEKSGLWLLPDYSFENMLLQNIVFVTAMFRKEDWQKLGGFSEQLHDGMEDYDFFIGILSLGRDIVQLPDTYFHYRIRKSSRTTDFLNKRDALRNAYSVIYDRHKDFYQKNADLYASTLRNALIQEKYEKEKALEVNGWIVKLKTNPIINPILKRIFRKK